MARCFSPIEVTESSTTPKFIIRQSLQLVSPQAGNRRLECLAADALETTKGDHSSKGGLAVQEANKRGYDRIIVLTDGQWHPTMGSGYMGAPNQVSPAPLTDRAYMINVSTEKNGVGYGKWTSIDGFSEAVLEYVRASETNTHWDWDTEYAVRPQNTLKTRCFTGRSVCGIPTTPADTVRVSKRTGKPTRKYKRQVKRKN